MTEHEHCPPILRTTARRLIAGKIVVTVRGAEDLRDALDRALAGPGPQIVCEVFEQVRL